MARIDFAWELGGHTGHVTTLLPIARALKSRGHDVRFLLKEVASGADLAGAADVPREGAPHWVGPTVFPNPRNFGEILHNFGYQHPVSLKQLVDAWRERLWLSDAVVANVAPAAHIAARTLGIPSLEVSQGFHNPPAATPSPPLRDWEVAPRGELEAADQRVLGAVNTVLAAYGVKGVRSIGELFADRSVLLTYPELDIYSERGPAEYYGIPDSGEGQATPPWPAGRGPRVFAYLYSNYPWLERLAGDLSRLDCSALIFCRDVAAGLRQRHSSGTVQFVAEPMSVSNMLPQCRLVICHASHQMTAQALLAGKPLLLLPTQLEQFLIMRRVVRQGAGLGIAMDASNPDFAAAIGEVDNNPRYAAKAAEFAARYAAHDRRAAHSAIVARCESSLRRAARLP